MSDQDQTGEMSARGNYDSDTTRADQDPTLARSPEIGGATDPTMGSPKGGGTRPASSSGLGRYGGEEEDDANALEAGTPPSSGLDPMGDPGAHSGWARDQPGAMSASGGGGGSRMAGDDEGTPMATFGPGGTTAAPNSGPSGQSGAGEWADSQLRERTQPWGSGGSGEVH